MLGKQLGGWVKTWLVFHGEPLQFMNIEEQNQLKIGSKVKVLELDEDGVAWTICKRGIVTKLTTIGACVFDPQGEYDNIFYAEWFPFEAKRLRMQSI